MSATAPKYHVVMGQIADLIVDTEPGSPVPTERELAAEFGTSRTTVRQALAALASSGRVVRTQGSGTFVARPNHVYVHQLTSYSEDLRAQGHSPSSSVVEVSKIEPGPEVVCALEITGKEKVNRLERLRYVDGEPLALEVAHLPGSFPRLRQEVERRGSLYAALREAYDVRLGRAEDVVECGMASPREATLLGVDAGAPMLVIRRTAYAEEDTPVEFTRSVFRGDRFRFVASSAF